MPLTLVPPKPGRTPNYRVRGKYLGVRVDRSTETPDKATAQRFLRNLKEAIERGSFSDRPALTLTRAMASYIDHGGEDRFLKPITDYFGPEQTLDISQDEADAAAAAIYPKGTPATRARQFFVPLIAVLRHAGLTPTLKKPKGSAGQARNAFLSADQVERLLTAASAEDAEFAALLIFFAYCGPRLSEALGMKCDGVDLGNSYAICGKTKNGDPRALHLPPRVVAALAAHPQGLDGRERLWRWRKGSELYLLAERLYAKAGVDHHGAPFHILRHTYGAHMTRVGADLVATGVWRSETAARVYKHFVVSEEAKKADLLPGAGGIATREKRAPRVRKKVTD